MKIVPSRWHMDSKKWSMGSGLANALFEWLGKRVDDSAAKGFQLVGCLDPENPDPTNIEQPPDWRNPDVMMKALCTWYGGGIEKALFDNGLIPVVRGRIERTANLFEFKSFVGAEGFDETSLLRRSDEFICRIRNDAFSEGSTISVTPVAGKEAAQDIAVPTTIDPQNPLLPPATVTNRVILVNYMEDDSRGWDLLPGQCESFYVHIYK